MDRSTIILAEDETPWTLKPCRSPGSTSVPTRWSFLLTFDATQRDHVRAVPVGT